VDEDNSSMNNSSIEDKKINEGSSSNGYGSYVSNSSRNASVSSVGNQSEKRSYSYHKPTRIVDEKFGRTMVEKKERIYQKNSCGTDEYSTADSNSKRCTSSKFTQKPLGDSGITEVEVETDSSGSGRNSSSSSDNLHSINSGKTLAHNSFRSKTVNNHSKKTVSFVGK
jgi:hypothetical protein